MTCTQARTTHWVVRERTYLPYSQEGLLHFSFRALVFVNMCQLKSYGHYTIFVARCQIFVEVVCLNMMMSPILQTS